MGLGLGGRNAPGRYSSKAVSAKVHGDIASRRSHGSHIRWKMGSDVSLGTRDTRSARKFREIRECAVVADSAELTHSTMR